MFVKNGHLALLQKFVTFTYKHLKTIFCDVGRKFRGKDRLKLELHQKLIELSEALQVKLAGTGRERLVPAEFGRWMELS